MNERGACNNPKRPVGSSQVILDLGKHLEKRGKDDKFEGKCIKLWDIHKSRVKHNESNS